jgi:uncharacterized protein (DUF305 family)
MKRIASRPGGQRLLAAAALVSCIAAASPAAAQVPTPSATAASAHAGPVHSPYTAADVAFMSGMIHHHAQAVLMAGWAPSHGAGASVRTLCERIVVAQRDEIGLMQRWLRDRNETVPEGDAAHDMMPGMEHVMMPGMLTAEQLAQLDSARGTDFDRLFLRFMIQHHQGAITMVNQLFGSQGGGEEETVFRFASDVYADQTTEIGRMQRMLGALLFAPAGGQ